MAILTPVQAELAPYGSDSPMVKCENCEATGPSHLMMNVMVAVGSPGHPAITGFQCPAIEHWSCSPGCWLVVAHACIDEHMHELLQLAHQKLREK